MVRRPRRGDATSTSTAYAVVALCLSIILPPAASSSSRRADSASESLEARYVTALDAPINDLPPPPLGDRYGRPHPGPPPRRRDQFRPRDVRRLDRQRAGTGAEDEPSDDGFVEESVVCVTSLESDLSSPSDQPPILEGMDLAEYVLCYGRAFDETYFAYDDRESAKIEYMSVTDQRTGIFVEDDGSAGRRRRMSVSEAAGDVRRRLYETGGGRDLRRSAGRASSNSRVRRRTQVRERVRFKCRVRCKAEDLTKYSDSMGRRRLLEEGGPDHPALRRLLSFERELGSCLAYGGLDDVKVTCGDAAERAWNEPHVEAEEAEGGGGEGTPAEGGGGGAETPPDDRTADEVCSTDRCVSAREALAPHTYDPSTLDDTSAPQFRAVVWLSDRDGLRVPVTDVRHLKQRYALATLFYAAGGSDGRWVHSAYFMSDDHECLWNQMVPEYGLNFPFKGVFCKDGETSVRDVTIPLNNLRGTIPPEMGLLTDLTYLSLFDNDLRGPLPPTLSLLTDLRHMDIQFNRLTGTIPTQYGALTELNQLSLGWNDITGTIPPEINGMTNLNILFLSDNRLSGSLPLEPGSLPNLATLEVRSNIITGTIPNAITTYTKMFTLDLSENDVRGPIPPDIGRLTSMAYLSLNDNRLGGTIPAGVSKLKGLVWMNLAGNQLRGSVPDLTGLDDLQGINLESNRLAGALPGALGNVQSLPSLRYLTLQRNSIQGDLSYLCDDDDTGGGGGISLLVSDCNGDAPEVTCTCCDPCCDDETGHCYANSPASA